MSRLNFIIALLVANFQLHGQDFVVLAKGDTIKGIVKISSFDQLDRVQVVGPKKQTFTAIQVRLLFIDKQYYKPFKFDNSIRFMKVLKQGYVSLLAFRPNGQGSWDGRFLAKMDGEGMEVPNLTFKKSLEKYFSDCPSLAEKLDKGEFSKRDLEKILDLYNACIQGQSDEKLANRNEPLKAVDNMTGLEKISEIKKLIQKVDAGDFLSKEDASDLLKDILKKVEKGEKVPNYLTEGLKSYLGPTPLNSDLEALLELLKK